MTNQFVIKKEDGTLVDIESLGVVVQHLDGLLFSDKKPIITRDWADQNGVDVYVPAQRFNAAKNINISFFIDGDIYSKMSVLTALLNEGKLEYRDYFRNIKFDFVLEKILDPIYLNNAHTSCIFNTSLLAYTGEFNTITAVKEDVMNDFYAKVDHDYNVSVLNQKDIIVYYPTNPKNGDSFYIKSPNNLELDSIIIGNEWIIESKDGESTAFTYNGSNWIPSSGIVKAYQKRVKIRMSGAGKMDFNIEGATGVRWEMHTGEIYTQNTQVPSGDINRPQINFTEAGWVKLYCDNFNTNVGLKNNSTTSLCVSNTGDFEVLKRTLILRNTNITGDISKLKDIYLYLDLFNCDLIESSSSFLNISANTMILDSCNLSQLEIYNLIKYNYDLNNTNKTLNIKGNAAPNAETQAMIDEMGKPIVEGGRGWSILT